MSHIWCILVHILTSWKYFLSYFEKNYAIDVEATHRIRGQCIMLVLGDWAMSQCWLDAGRCSGIFPCLHWSWHSTINVIYTV